METGRLKRFAVESRNTLRAGVLAKIRTLGFNADGSLMTGVEAPVEVPGGSIWNGQILPASFAPQWLALQHRIDAKGIREVVEEGAYMWFNRLMALRILAKNGICEPVLRFVDEARTPKIVDDARQGRLIPMPEDQSNRLRELFKDPTAVNEQFALLITEYCHQTPVVQACFGALADYTELLLPSNILAEGGFIDMMNHDDFISDADYQSAELIGWLYQFYISDRKDEVFAKKGKVEADEIPAATQIFTPNWIVKYMVQNAVLPQVRSTRLPELDKQYLIEHEAPEEPKRPRDLRVADLACGSGHILNECFDLLFDLYVASGFGRGEAIENIFRYNLTGIDIDQRARQLSTFALMLKACQRDESMVDAHVMPQVLGMPEIEEPTEAIAAAKRERFYGACDISGKARQELDAAFDLMLHADSLGSIMKFDISASTRLLIEQTLAHFAENPDAKVQRSQYFRSLPLILALTDSYDAIVMNPPYMGGGKFNDCLKAYANKAYPISKADLFSIFMEMAINRLKDGGRTGCITMESWMFLSSFESFRKWIVDNHFISSLGHFGWHIIGIAFGTAMTLIEKSPANGRKGVYSYLTIDDVDKELKKPVVYPKTDNGRYAIADQKQFEQIPGSPIAYWVSEKVRESFSQVLLDDCVDIRIGMGTGKNDYFLKKFWEVSDKFFNTSIHNVNELDNLNAKYVPYNKGGGFRKWYGNLEDVIWYDKNGRHELDKTSGHRENGGLPYYFKPGGTWSFISSKNFGVRYLPSGCVFDVAGSSMFAKDRNIEAIIAFLCSKIAISFLKILNPTVNYQAGNLKSLPLLCNDKVGEIAKSNISISKEDWDAHETSWDFQGNPLVRAGVENLQSAIEAYECEWEAKYRQLHANEEELNRQFIEIYGLQDELTPDVPLDEVTILQQGEMKIEDGELSWQRDVIIKQLISYIVGCYMGRYRLDRPGRAIAHPQPTADELAEYSFAITSNEQFTIDDDAIIPILPNGAPFDDNITEYISQFVMKVWDAESHMANLNFMEHCLGKKLEDYVHKDFWKDHKKMYQNRPIYWLFSSKKGAFKALVYAHRMTPYTAEQVRSRYLLKYMDWLRSEAQRLEIREVDLTTHERKHLDRLRTDLAECDEYHERLQVVAESEIGFDLDNGIIKNHALFGDVLTKLK